VRAAEMKDGSPSHLALLWSAAATTPLWISDKITNVILIQSAVAVPMNRDSAGALQNSVNYYSRANR